MVPISRTTKRVVFCRLLVISGCLALSALGAGASALAEPTDEPTGVLTLRRAIAAVLVGSPDLAVFGWQIRASESRRLQAGMRPNPEIGLEVEDVAGTGNFAGVRQAQTTLRLSQVIELGGQRAARQEVATATRDMATRAYEVKRVEVLADAADKLIRVLGAQRELDLAREASALAETAARAVRSRIVAGRASALEETKARIAVARNRINEEHAAHELAVLRHHLSATWGSTAPRFERVQGDLLALQPIPAFEQLASRVATSPEVARWVSETKLRQAEIILAESKRVPNLTALAGARRLEGVDAETFLFQLTMPLPIFDRNQGNVGEARSLAEHTDAGKRGAEVRLHTLLFGLYQELLHAETALQLLQQEILPQTKEALALSQRGFDEGRFSYLESLDAQRTFIEVRKEAIATAVRYHEFLLGIERLIGQPLDALGAEP